MARLTVGSLVVARYLDLDLLYPQGIVYVEEVLVRRVDVNLRRKPAASLTFFNNLSPFSNSGQLADILFCLPGQIRVFAPADFLVDHR